LADPLTQVVGFQVASFIDLKEDQVILKLKGKNQEITVPFSKLSKEDQKYVQQIVGE
jgi:hypothetical protein